MNEIVNNRHWRSEDLEFIRPQKNRQINQSIGNTSVLVYSSCTDCTIYLYAVRFESIALSVLL